MRTFLIVLAAMLSVAGCSPAGDDGAGGSFRGSLSVTYSDVPDDLADLADGVRDSGVVEHAVDLVNDRVRLARDVTVDVGSCSEGTGYDPETHRIDICLEEVAESRRLLEQAGAKDVEGETLAGVVETITHEAGHAVLDVDRLRFTGREETVADQFSAYVLIGGDGTDGLDVLESVAYSYELSAEAFEAIPSDEHDSDTARAINFQCWVYGADRRDSAHLVSEDGLAKERAEYCGDEWADLRDGWNALLADAGALRHAVK